MSNQVSKSQIDRLGSRLKYGNHAEGDLRTLDDYRRSFSSAYELVVRAVRRGLRLEPTGRPAKSTTSIVEKLRRESIRLSQVQDIAGCRVLVKDRSRQDRVVKRLTELFSDTVVIDRRKYPSHGYRAVHVVVRIDSRPIELQVRTVLQHEWAELSEKLSDTLDMPLKYGGGPEPLQHFLETLAEMAARQERFEQRCANLRERGVRGPRMQRLMRMFRKQRRYTIGMYRVFLALSDKMNIK